MRVNLRTLGGRLLVSGELHGTPMELQQSLVQNLVTFELSPPTTVAATPTLPVDTDQADGDRPQHNARRPRR